MLNEGTLVTDFPEEHRTNPTIHNPNIEKMVSFEDPGWPRKRIEGLCG